MIETNCKKTFGSKIPKRNYNVLAVMISDIKHLCIKDTENEKLIVLSGNAISINAINRFANWLVLHGTKTSADDLFLLIISAAGEKHEG